MEAYSILAKFYDEFMTNVPYEEWADFIDFAIRSFGVSEAKRGAVDPLESERNLLLDMGCGTGKLTRMMYDKGYDLIGIDISEEMLDEARAYSDNIHEESELEETELDLDVQSIEETGSDLSIRFIEETDTYLAGQSTEETSSGSDSCESEEDEDYSLADDNEGILYLCQDMCQLDLYCTVGTIYSSCDSVNYLLEDREIRQCFDRVENFLYPGGIFIFDFNTLHKYRDVIGDSTITDSTDEATFIWDNYFDEEERINQYDLTLFIRETEDNLYSKEEETHFQRGYEIAEMEKFLEEADLTVLGIIDEKCLSDERCRKQLVNDAALGVRSYIGITEDTERAIVIAKKMKDTQ